MKKLCIATIVALAASLPGQYLRRAVASADVVVVAKAMRILPTKTHILHRLQVETVLRAPRDFDKSQKLTVAVPKRVSVHNRPIAAKRMLYCLHDNARAAAASGLPANFAPYYKMSGYAGSAVVLDAKHDPRLAFAQILVASQKGQASRKTAEQLFPIALTGDKRIRIEAVQALAERPALLTNLTDLHLSKILARATGETVDIRYKIELAGLCANRRLPGLIQQLCLSVEQVGDRAFLQALGRYAKFVHGRQAHEVLRQQIVRAKGKTRDRLIVAMGATSTEGALDWLLKVQKRGQYKVAVEAALRLHGSPRAAAAIRSKKVGEKADGKGK